MSARNRSLSRSRVKPGELPRAAVTQLAKKADIPILQNPNFATIGIVKRHYLNYISEGASSMEWALCRTDGCIFRSKLPVFDHDHAEVAISVYLVGALIQEMIWQRSGSSLVLSGPTKVCESIKSAFSAGGLYEFEAIVMPHVSGAPGKAFEVSIVEESDMPAAKSPLGQEKKVNYYEMALKTCVDKARAGEMSNEEESGFYAIYAAIFEAIAKEEDACEVGEDDDGDRRPFPSFGIAASNSSAMTAFYTRWLDFASRKSFDDAAEWNPTEADRRDLRRGMDKQNKVLRQAAKKRFNQEVRELVAYVQKRDPRHLAHQRALAQEKMNKTQRRHAEREIRKATEAQRRMERREAQRCEEEERWTAAKQARRDRGEAVSDDEQNANKQETVEYECEPCGKSFKSKNQFQQHLKTKKHLQMVADVLAEVGGQDDDSTDGLEEDGNDKRTDAAPPGEAPADAQTKDSDTVDSDARSDLQDEDAGSGKENEDHGPQAEDSSQPTRGPGAGALKHRSVPSVYRCDICKMKFETDKLYDAHMKSKKHKAELAFKKQMEELLAEEGPEEGDQTDAPATADKQRVRVSLTEPEAQVRARVTVQVDGHSGSDDENGLSKREKKAKQRVQTEKARDKDGENDEDEECLTHAERQRRKLRAKQEALLEKGGADAAPKAAPKARRALHCRRNAHGGGRVGGGMGGR